MAAAGGAGGAAPSALPLGAPPLPGTPPRTPGLREGPAGTPRGCHDPLPAGPRVPPRAVPTRDRDTHLPRLRPDGTRGREHRRGLRDGTGRDGSAFGRHGALHEGLPRHRAAVQPPAAKSACFGPKKSLPGAASSNAAGAIFAPPHGELGGKTVSVSRKRLKGGGSGGKQRLEKSLLGGFKAGGSGSGIQRPSVPCPPGGQGARRAPRAEPWH